MKLLVADDDPQLVRALRITLAAHGYDVIAAGDGAAAIAMAAQAHPDIVLLDLGMPKLDGIAVIEACAAGATCRSWSSGRTGSADKVEALDAGADDYVTSRSRWTSCSRGCGARPPPRGRRRSPPCRSARSRWIWPPRRDARRRPRAPDADGVADPGASGRHPGALVTRQELLREIWGTEQITDTGYLRLYLSQPRARSRAHPSAPEHLLTEQGMGHRLVLDPA
jgi:two-component system KDP operon response regulator KdpE